MAVNNAANAIIRFSDSGAGALEQYRHFQIATNTGTTDFQRGSQVTLDFIHNNGGLAPPGPPTTVEIRVYIDGTPGSHGSMTQVGTTMTLTSPAANTIHSVSFWLTQTGTSGTANRIGTLQIHLRVIRSGQPTGNYDVSSTADFNTPPTGYPVTVRDQGYIRSNPLGSEVTQVFLSNVAQQGAKNTPAAFNDTLFHRTLLPVTPWNDSDFGVTAAVQRPNLSNVVTSAVTGTGQAQLDASWPINSTFDRALTTYTGTATVRTSSLTGIAWANLGSIQTDTITADPRWTFRTLFQVNTSRFTTAGEGEFFLDQTSRQMLASDMGYLLKKATNARGQAITGAQQWTENFSDAGGQLGLTDRTVRTDNQSGVGRPGGLGINSGWGYPSSGGPWRVWSETKPGGGWLYRVTSISGQPTDMIVDPDQTVTMLAVNPDLFVLSAMGNALTSGTGDHWTEGKPLLAGVGVWSSTSANLIAADASPTPTVVLLRFNTAVGKVQFLNASNVWTNLDPGTAIHRWPLSQGQADNRVWITTFATTTGWGDYDISGLFRVFVNATPYQTRFPLEVVSPIANRHAAPDLGGLLGIPL